MEDFKQSYSFQQFVKCFLVSKWPLLNFHLFRKIFISWGEMDILEHIYRQFLRKTCFCNFTHFIVIYGLLQFFKFSDEEKMHAIQLPLVFRIFVLNAWSLRFFVEIISSLIGAHLGGGSCS